jgi:hypothetical protein
MFPISKAKNQKRQRYPRLARITEDDLHPADPEHPLRRLSASVPGIETGIETWDYKVVPLDS